MQSNNTQGRSADGGGIYGKKVVVDSSVVSQNGVDGAYADGGGVYAKYITVKGESNIDDILGVLEDPNFMLTDLRE